MLYQSPRLFSWFKDASYSQHLKTDIDFPSSVPIDPVVLAKIAGLPKRIRKALVRERILTIDLRYFTLRKWKLAKRKRIVSVLWRAYHLDLSRSLEGIPAKAKLEICWILPQLQCRVRRGFVCLLRPQYFFQIVQKACSRAFHLEYSHSIPKGEWSSLVERTSCAVQTLFRLLGVSKRRTHSGLKTRRAGICEQRFQGQRRQVSGSWVFELTSPSYSSQIYC